MRKLSIIVYSIILALVLSCPAEAGPFIAYSMKEAQRCTVITGQANLEVSELGEITDIAGMVYDPKNKDLIIVGQANEGKPKITLDDFVVAMRAGLVHNKTPLVSIDRTPETATTGKQVIRWEGGIENTQLGKDMLEADILLKEIALARVRAEVWGVRSYFSMVAEQGRKGKEEGHIASRFWFKNFRPSLAVREDVFAIMELDVGVKTEVLYAEIEGKRVQDMSGIRDEVGDMFAKQVAMNFSDLSIGYPVLARARPILALVSLVEGMKHLDAKSQLNFWLYEYKVSSVETPKNYELIEVKEEIEGRNLMLTVSGGIELNPIVVRLKKGYVSALKETVLNSRPPGNVLIWHPPLEGWHIPGTEDIETGQSLASPSGRKGGFSVDRVLSKTGETSTAIGSRPYGSSLSPLRAEIPKFDIYRNLPSQGVFTDIGGVMLQGSAKASGSKDAQVNLSDGTFSLVVDGQNARLDPKMFRKFVTALWAVYFGQTVPGISIDPIYQDPEMGGFSEKHMVRYIGRVVNTDLGRVMRQADYQMKKWSVGTEKPNIPGFETPDEYAARTGKFYASLSRFWLTPETMQFKASDNMLLFDEGHMTIKTEVLGYDVGEKPANPQNEAFAQSFTKYYDEIAQKYPIYKELADYGKLVALAKYLKDSGVPLFWFLMANKDLILTEDSPGTVNNLAKESDYCRGITIQGGVDMSKGGRYVYDDAAVKAMEKAWEKAESCTTHSTFMTGAKQRAPSIPFSFEMGTNQYTVVPQHSLTCGKDRRGIRYQTDLCLRAEGYKVTEKVVDVMKSEILRQAVQSQLRPILEEMSDEEAEEKSQTLVAQCYEKALKNVKTLMEKVERLSDQKYETADECAAAWEKAMVGAAAVELRPMFVTWCHYVSNLELVRYFNPDCQGNSQFGKGWHLLVPYQIEPAGQTKTEFLNILIPEKMAVKNLLTGEQEVLTFNEDHNSIAGYVPDKLQSSQIVGLFIMSDASYRLVDKLGNEFCFDPAGYLTDMSFSQDHRVHFEYLHTFTEDFEQLPYQLEAVGEDQVEFLNILLPKTMVVKDLVNGSSEVLTFSDKPEISGYVPENKENSRFKILILMSDGSFRLHDKKGNEIALSAAGDFKCFAVSPNYPIVKSVSAGLYKINFKYTIDNSGRVLIANANLSEKGKVKPLYAVRYEYDSKGRLCRVIPHDRGPAKDPEISLAKSYQLTESTMY